MSEVFISYARADREFASNLARALEIHGISVWWDTALSSGDAFRAHIDEALQQAAAVIVIWSPNSVQSDWVLSEASHAQRTSKLIPIQIGDARIPLPFQAVQTLSMESWAGELDDPRFQSILRALMARGVRPTEKGDTQPSEVPDTADGSSAKAEGPIFEAKPEDTRLDSKYIDVFVAYSRRDSTRCEDFILQLRRQDLDVFYDQFIRSGESWRQAIAQHIIGCSVFVVMLSGHSITSAEVRNEINLATTHGKKIIPVFVEDIALPGDFELMLSGVNYVHAFEDFDRRFVEAAEEAKTLVALDAFNARRALAAKSGSRSTAGTDAAREIAPSSRVARQFSPFWITTLVLVAAGFSASLTAVFSAIGTPVEMSAINMFSLTFFVLGLPYAILLVHGIKNLVAVASD